jgi:hypothetical protein
MMAMIKEMERRRTENVKMTEHLDGLLRPALRANRILWFTMTGSIFIYVAVVYVIAGKGDASLEVRDSLGNVFYGVACVFTVLSIALRRIMFSTARLKGRLEIEMCPKQLSTDPQTKKVDLDRLKKVGELTKSELKILGLVRWIYIPNMAVLAIDMGIVILGVFFAFIQKSPELSLPFAAIGFFLNIPLYGNLGLQVKKARAVLETSAPLTLS